MKATPCAAAVRKLHSFVISAVSHIKRYGGMRALAESVPVVSIIILWRLQAGGAKPIVHVRRGFSLPRLFSSLLPEPVHRVAVLLAPEAFGPLQAAWL